MSLKIENLKLDKDVYTFGVDKEIKGSFTLVSDGKDYKINSVNIKHGVIFYLRDKEHSRNLEDLVIAENIQILGNEPQKFEFIVPIKYPNVGKKEKTEKYDEDKDESEYYFDSYVFNNNIKVKNYIKIIADIKLNPFDCKKEIFPEINIEIEKSGDSLSKKDDISKEKGVSYINIGFKEKELVNQEFYNYLNENFKSFKYREFIRKNSKIFGYLLLIDFLGMVISLSLVKADININLINFNYILVFFMFITFTICLNGIFILYTMKNIKNRIVNIKLNNINKIKESLTLKNNIEIKDIIESININYYGNYNCKFNIYLTCLVKISRREGSGKTRKTVEYYKTIYITELGNYTGNRLKIEDINNLNLFNEKLKVPFKDFGKKVEILYKIIYKFESPEIIDKTSEINIGGSKNLIAFLNNFIKN